MLMCVFSLFSRFLWIYSPSIPIFSLTSEDQCLSSDQTLLVKDIHTLGILTVSSDQSTISLPPNPSFPTQDRLRGASEHSTSYHVLHPSLHPTCCEAALGMEEDSSGEWRSRRGNRRGWGAEWRWTGGEVV